MRKIEGERDPTKIQCVANTIAWMARRLAFDDAFMSPFAQNAQENGIDAIGKKKDYPNYPCCILNNIFKKNHFI